MTPLRPLLSSKETLIVLDNAESILDPKEPGAKEIYSVMDELCQFETICLCITSRITTVPTRCQRPDIPALSVEAACDIFYGIYRNIPRSNTINDLLERLDFHALSIKLLATTASHNGWDHNRLSKEWDTQRARVLRTDYNDSLAATIELSLASPTFLSLSPDARDLLGVVAFFPQGIYEKNLDWLFPTTSNRNNTFDKFCVLSLTHRSNGFITMLAPIRDYLGPSDPRSSPLLCTTRDHYFNRLSVNLIPGMPGFEEARWIVLEDVNIEYLLNVFASIDQTNNEVWKACSNFVYHLVWHKPRPTILGSKIEALPDDHPSKPRFLFGLSGLFQQIGNHAERKRVLTHTLELGRQRGSREEVADTLKSLSDANRLLGLNEEGIQQAKEALEIFEQVNDTRGQAESLNYLAWLLVNVKQFEDAEDAASRGIDLLSDKSDEYILSGFHRILGKVHEFKGEEEEAIHHLQTAIGIATPFNWRDLLYWTHNDLAGLFRDGGKFEDANLHIEQAKSLAVDSIHFLGGAAYTQATIWHQQGRLEDAKTEALRAFEIFDTLGATVDCGNCENLLQEIERATGL